MSSISGVAQISETGERQISQLTQTTAPNSAPYAGSEAIVVTIPASAETIPANAPASKSGSLARFEQLISTAIDDRLGARYMWGAEGPFSFDCSGFVWSTFHSAGIDFERVSARTLWARFSPAAPDEQYKIGTLVFFSGLAHVGIVADAHGFYHASRHHGVTYSPFNDYWVSRIDGFRRVPLPVMPTAE